jgi:hypothetical protein
MSTYELQDYGVLEGFAPGVVEEAGAGFGIELRG